MSLCEVFLTSILRLCWTSGTGPMKTDIFGIIWYILLTFAGRPFVTKEDLKQTSWGRPLDVSLSTGKDLRVTKSFKQIKFEEIWDELEAKNYFQRQYIKIFNTLVFIGNSTLRKKFNLSFSRAFCKYFSFWQEGWALGYYSMKF